MPHVPWFVFRQDRDGPMVALKQSDRDVAFETMMSQNLALQCR